MKKSFSNITINYPNKKQIIIKPNNVPDGIYFMADYDGEIKIDNDPEQMGSTNEIDNALLLGDSNEIVNALLCKSDGRVINLYSLKTISDETIFRNLKIVDVEIHVKFSED